MEAVPPPGIRGRTRACQTNAATPIGTRMKKAPRQPIRPPRKLPSGAAMTAASAVPPCSMASAFGTSGPATMRATMAVASDQKPPIDTPISARPTMKMR